MSRTLICFVTHIWTRQCDEFLVFAGRHLREHVCLLIFKAAALSPMGRSIISDRCSRNKVILHIAPTEGYDFDGYIHALNHAPIRPISSYSHFIFVNSSVRATRPSAYRELLDVLDRDPSIGLVGATINAHFEFYGLEKRLHPHVQSGVFAFRADLLSLMLEHNILSGGPMDKWTTIVRREIRMSDVVLEHAKLNIAETAGMYSGVDFRPLYRKPLSITQDPVTNCSLYNTIYFPGNAAQIHELLKQNRLTFVKVIIP